MVKVLKQEDEKGSYNFNIKVLETLKYCQSKTLEVSLAEIL